MRRFPGVVLELRTARANGVPHGTIRFGRKPSKWAERDRLLALALTAYEDGLCPHCGQPRDRAWNDDMEGHYTVHRATCVACQAKHMDLDVTPLGKSESAWVSDDAPPGFVPDARMSHIH